MTQKKNTYTAPIMEVTQVEIEASICSGSVEFGGERAEDNQQVVIQDQSINTNFNAATTNGSRDMNDFSSNAWGD